MVVTRSRSFYKMFFALFFPLVLQDVINLSVNLADNVMLGAYSEVALSGATAVNQLQFFLQCVVSGVGSGVTVLGSQYWGQGRTEPVKRLTSFAFLIVLTASTLFFAACRIVPRDIVSMLLDSQPAIQEGMAYLNVLSYSYIPYAISTVLLLALNSVETVKVSFFVSVETLIVNILLNLLLIPRYGSAGAAAATVMSRLGAFACIVAYLSFGDRKLRLRFGDLFKLDKLLCRDYIRVSIPLIVIFTLWGCNNVLQTAILGHLDGSQSVVAASGATMALYSLFKAASQSASNAAGIIMAKTVGSGDIKKVREYAGTFQVIFITIGLISASILFAVKDTVFAFYDMSAETLSLAKQFILVMCVCVLGMSYQMPTIAGIIRGGGDPRFGMINDIISIWGIVLPVSYLAAYVWHWPPVAVVACLNADQIFKCIPAAIRCNRFGWVRKLTRDEPLTSENG